MRPIFAFWLVIFSALLPACAGITSQLDRDQFAKVKTVSVREEVSLPSSGMYFNDQSLKMAGLFGAGIGAAIWSRTDPAPVKVAKMMEANDIVVERILRNEFVQELQRSNRFLISSSGPADAEFRLTIKKYGLSSIPWHRELQPVVAAKVELISSNGTVIWTAHRDMSNHSDRIIPAILFDDYMANIELLRDGYTSACRIVTKDLVNALIAP